MLTLPAFDALRSSFPEARITALLRDYTADLLRAHPSVDEILIHRPESEHAGWAGLSRLISVLRDHAFDAALMVYGKADLAWALWRAGIPIRVGNGYRPYGALLCNRRLWLHRSKPMIHEKDYALRFAEALGARPREEASRLFLDPIEGQEAEAFLRAEGLDGHAPLALVHPGNAGSARNVGEGSYARFADALASRGLVVAFTGLEQERDRVARVMDAMTFPAKDFAGRLGLRQLAAVIARARCLVVSSTGPLHVASAVGTPSIALFSPLRAESPIKWGPLHPRSVVLQPPDLRCERCRPEDCTKSCMEGISLEAFEAALDRILEGESP